MPVTEFTVKDHSENIIDAWNAASAQDLAQGLEWYGLARDIAASFGGYGVDVETAAGVIAALSPLNSWRVNIGQARALIDRHHHKLPEPTAGYGLKLNVAKAWRILDGEPPLEVLSGDKVRAFYSNILGDETVITIDRWAVRIAHADPTHSGTVTRKDYRELSDAYRVAAAERGVSARDLQAATWTYYRRIHGRNGQDPKQLDN